ncbi:MAG: ATP-binding cassette domain-containing protein [Candidatus Latescibacteria bacterium]|nr:ATP-binding cassette domain-containing protein [Candidatus Latescibacterota bacterium]
MVSLHHVSKIIDGRVILEDVSLSLAQGEFAFIVGPTGAGKSTLLRLLYFGDVPSEGELIVGDYRSSVIRHRDIPFVRRKIGVVFQDGKLLDDRTVFENVALPLYVIGIRRSVISRRVFSLLSQVGLAGRSKEFPSHLSGGERQRVAIARAIVNTPFLLLSDEPTGSLDAHSAQEIVGLLESVCHSGTTVLMATHDEELAAQTGYRVIRLEQGRIVEDTGKREEGERYGIRS